MYRVFFTIFLFVQTPLVIFGMTPAAFESEIKSAILQKVQRQVAMFSDVDVAVSVQFPPDGVALVAQAAYLQFPVHDHGNYIGRSVIPVTLLDRNRRSISMMKAVVDVDVIGNYVVSAKRLPTLHYITSSDVRIQRGEVNGVSRQSFGSLSQVVGREVASTISEGSALTQMTVRDVPAVRRGDSILVDYRKESILLKVPGEALSDGQVGERIKVRLKLGSQKIMEGHIVDSTTVFVRAAY